MNARKDQNDDFAMMSFGDHLEDLRRRVLFGIVGLIPLFITAFALGGPVLDLLIAPAREELHKGGQTASLLATAPFETFGTVVHIAIVATVLFGAPWLLYQLWLFVAPGLYRHERRFVHFLTPLSMVLAALGIVFLYFVILPVVLAFFINFGNNITQAPTTSVETPPGMVLPNIPVLDGDPAEPAPGQYWFNTELNQIRLAVPGDKPDSIRVGGLEIVAGSGIVQQYKISEYVKTVLNMGLAFGIGFQMPVVVVMLGWLGILAPKDLRRYRKHILAACFVASAILTPADPMSMVLLAVPLYLLFEFGLVLLKIFPADKIARREPDTDDEHAD